MAEENKRNSRAGALDDEQRVKVLSPSMLVFKRFIRNKLAIVGVAFILFMFLFAFVGGWVSPYGEDQVFTHYEGLEKDFASVTVNTDYRYTVVDGQAFDSLAQSKFILALNTGAATFEAQGKTYSFEQKGQDLYVVNGTAEVARGMSNKMMTAVKPVEGVTLPDGFEAAANEAIKAGQTAFEFEGVNYVVTIEGKEASVGTGSPVALASKTVYDTVDSSIETGFDFRLAAETAMQAGATSFEADGVTYGLSVEPEVGATITRDGEMIALASNTVVNSYISGQVLTLEFKDAAKEAIADDLTEFEFEGATYVIYRNNTIWDIRSETQTQVVNAYEAPSFTHWLGTDGNGMDLLTRIMYGGRVSLVIGFIVVFIAAFLGVILGGVAGYFGKWVDSVIMRIVDIFNCIPSTPLIIILGSIMDAERVDPQIRMLYLMLILGFLSWPGVARLVRGQILSLREQEFMTATEACGLTVSHRIFRHLVPNVMPQLIVTCTMSLGSTIITESTLSFLGLGVKYPFASWGNIISAVSTVHVMTNYWFVWIPAGLCILITVLGFNFVGDGLRDAFDPKMKR
ncbi:MAG: ABC transporter permease [Candidatus Spyradocola sp.]|nr:ABC transporter permease [Candidatus Spyradocola sp.]